MEVKDRGAIYLAGKITGDPYYKHKFYTAAGNLEKLGFKVINPAILPADALPYDAYIRITRAMLIECPQVCLLSDWVDSEGAQGEFGLASARGKTIYDYEVLITYLDTEAS